METILVFQSEAITQGQWWRLVSGHFLHTNFNHFLMNSIGLILLWALHGEYYRPITYLTLFLLCCIGTGLGLLFGSDITQYVGLSGTLHGIFVWGALSDIQKGYRSGWLLFVGVWIKVIYEQIAGPSDIVAGLIASNVAIDAHFFGTLTGSLYIVWLFKRQRAPESAL